MPRTSSTDPALVKTAVEKLQKHPTLTVSEAMTVAAVTVTAKCNNIKTKTPWNDWQTTICNNQQRHSGNSSSGGDSSDEKNVKTMILAAATKNASKMTKGANATINQATMATTTIKMQQSTKQRWQQ